MNIPPLDSAAALSDLKGAQAVSGSPDLLIQPLAKAFSASHTDFSAYWRSAGMPLQDNQRILVGRDSETEYELCRFLGCWAQSRAACLARRETPLHFAAMIGNRLACRALMEAGAAIEARDVRGATPLLRAAECEDYEVALQFVRAGADVNACNHEGATALHRAAELGHRVCAMILLGHGADPSVKNDDGMCPLALASADVREDLEKLIETLEIEKPTKKIAETEFEFPVLRTTFLIDRGAAVNTVRQWSGAMSPAASSVRAAAQAAAPRGAVANSVAVLQVAVFENQEDELVRMLRDDRGPEWTPNDIELLLQLSIDLDRPRITELLLGVRCKSDLGAGPSRIRVPDLPSTRSAPLTVARRLQLAEGRFSSGCAARDPVHNLIKRCGKMGKEVADAAGEHLIEQVFEAALIRGRGEDEIVGGVALVIAHAGLFEKPSRSNGGEDASWVHRLARLGREAEDGSPDTLSLVERFSALAEAGMSLVGATYADDPHRVAFAAGNHAALRALIAARRGRPAHATPLHLAAEVADEALCLALIDAGENPQATDWQKFTPYERAIACGHFNLAQTLWEKGHQGGELDENRFSG